MKAKLFLLSAMALTAMASCTKEAEVQNPPVESNTPGVLVIKFDDGSSSRAAGAPVVGTETAITTVAVFVFKGTSADPALDARATVDYTGGAVLPITVNITQGIRQVYVVANVNLADFSSINNLSDLQHLDNKLSLSNFRTNGALAMSGFKRNVSALAASTSVTIPLAFVGSRVHVDWDVTNLNAGLTGLVINGAAILNVNAKSEYFATDNGSGGFNPLTHNLYDFLQGVGDTSPFVGSYLPSVNMAVATTNINDTELFIPAANKGFVNNYTYLFENSSSKPVIVTIMGTHNSTAYYWPIVINGALNGIGGSNAGNQTASIVRGNIYNVKAVIKGNGNEDPYAPINPGVIEVTITPAAWNPVINIDQEFK